MLKLILLVVPLTLQKTDYEVGFELESKNFSMKDEFYTHNPVYEKDGLTLHTDDGDDFYILEWSTIGGRKLETIGDLLKRVWEDLENFTEKATANILIGKKVFTKSKIADSLTALQNDIKQVDEFTNYIKSEDKKLWDKAASLRSIDKLVQFYVPSTKWDSASFNKKLEEAEKMLNEKSSDLQENEKNANFLSFLIEENAEMQKAFNSIRDFFKLYKAVNTEIGITYLNNMQKLVLLKKELYHDFSLGLASFISVKFRNKQNEEVTYFVKCQFRADYAKSSDAKANYNSLMLNPQHTFKILLAQVPYLYSYYISDKFAKSFQAPEGLLEKWQIERIKDMGRYTMFIYSTNNMFQETNALKLRMISQFLNKEAHKPEEPIKYDPKMHEELIKNLMLIPDDAKYATCLQKWDGLGLFMLYLNYALEMFIGHNTSMTNTEQIKYNEHGPKELTTLMSRVGFKKMYTDLSDCAKELFKDKNAQLCGDEGVNCESAEITAYGMGKNVEWSEEFRFSLMDWYESIIGDIPGKLQMGSFIETCDYIDAKPDEPDKDFNSYFFCSHTDLLSPPFPWSAVMSKENLLAQYEIYKNEPNVRSIMRMIAENQGSPMGRLKLIPKDYVVLERRGLGINGNPEVMYHLTMNHLTGIKVNVVDPWDDEEAKEPKVHNHYTTLVQRLIL